jgi:hypothetical protein
LKLATWWNAAGMFVVAVLAAFASVSTEARAMLVYSYYSDQIIITTDERRSGPVDLPPEVGPSIAACWRAPHEGDQITVQPPDGIGKDEFIARVLETTDNPRIIAALAAYGHPVAG